MDSFEEGCNSLGALYPKMFPKDGISPILDLLGELIMLN